MSVGRLLVREQEKVQEIQIYARDYSGAFYQKKVRGSDVLQKGVCTQFAFNVRDEDELFFFSKKEVFAYNYMTGKRRTIYKMVNHLNRQPNFGMFSRDQSKFIVTSNQDVLYVNNLTNNEIDLDEKYQVSSIQNIIASETHFYVLANKRRSQLGMFLFSCSIEEPENPASNTEYLNWYNKMDIGDVDLQLMDQEGGSAQNIVVSYKSIGINTYNILVIDLETGLIKHWYESY